MPKPCTVCRKTLPLSKFNKNGRTKDSRGSQCKRCDVEQSARRKQERKRILVEQAGGKCSRCGYNKCPAALDFHHHKGDKSSNVTDLMRHSLEKAIKEAKKCVLLCANCHREEHYIDYGPLKGRRRRQSACGTSGGYKACGPPKCEKCKVFKREYMSRYRSGGRGGN